jgi:hypothetical protein
LSATCRQAFHTNDTRNSADRLSHLCGTSNRWIRAFRGPRRNGSVAESPRRAREPGVASPKAGMAGTTPVGGSRRYGCLDSISRASFADSIAHPRQGTQAAISAVGWRTRAVSSQAPCGKPAPVPFRPDKQGHCPPRLHRVPTSAACRLLPGACAANRPESGSSRRAAPRCAGHSGRWPRVCGHQRLPLFGAVSQPASPVCLHDRVVRSSHSGYAMTAMLALGQ